MKTLHPLEWTLCLTLAWAVSSVALAENNTNAIAPRLDRVVVAPSPPDPQPPVLEWTSHRDVPVALPVAVSETTAASKKQTAAKVRLSPWAAEIAKLSEAGIEENVLLSFIDNSGTFNLGADQIIHLSGLGISSQVINAMLQHDQDVISGARPLTIASDPTPDPVVSIKFAARNDIPDQPTSPSSTPPVQSATARSELGNIPAENAPPIASPTAADAQSSPVQYIATEAVGVPGPSLFERPLKPADKKRSLYPVREPHAVELTAPIVFINSADAPPNTVIIVGFPRSNP